MPLAEPSPEWADVTPAVECSTAENERARFQRAREKADAARSQTRPEVGRESTSDATTPHDETCRRSSGVGNARGDGEIVLDGPGDVAR
jgi:hypothetical protein